MVGRSGERQRVRHVLALLVLQALNVHGLRAPAAARKSASLQGKLDSFEENVVQFASGAGTVIVDGDNVRGKSGFAVGHMELVRASSIWADQRGLEGRLVVCIDHGSSADAWYLSELGVAVCFAGPVGTADDLIAWCRGRLAGFKCPRSVDFHDAMPREATGKLKKRHLRDVYWQGRERAI